MRAAEECRAIAKAKIGEAKRNKRRRRSLMVAAEAWSLLASRIEQTPSFDLEPGKQCTNSTRRSRTV
jgi:hypothetical protein